MEETMLHTVSDPELVRVFVAATPAEWLPMKVLEFSIREQTELPVELSAIYTHARTIPVPKDPANRARTPFSFQRFLIPELCNFQGKAIYMDADMQVFQDISSLWKTPFLGSDLQTVGNGSGGRRSQFSVVLLDCAQLNWKIEDIIAQLDDGTLTYQTLMFDMKVAKSVSYSLPEKWNSLEHFERGETCLLHYTDMNIQPWVSLSNPNGQLWVECLKRAIEQGFITRQQLNQEVALGHVRPSLISQVTSDSLSNWKPSLGEIWRDLHFSPPFYAITASNKGGLRTALSKLSRALQILKLAVVSQPAHR
ncbi:glycosyltransferase [Pseudomonas sp. Pseu.R1]|uniref:glycosyltransferase n=1 Tax=Pseudomonas sp. Pseu.R1 TaxID=3379818 RepID=UPI003B9651CE